MSGTKDPTIKSVRLLCRTCRSVTEHRLYTTTDGRQTPRCLPCMNENNRLYRERVAKGYVPEARHQKAPCAYDLLPGEHVCPRCFLTSCDCREG